MTIYGTASLSLYPFVGTPLARLLRRTCRLQATLGALRLSLPSLTAVVVPQPLASLEPSALRQRRECRTSRLAVHNIHHRLRVLSALPRNAMGKVTKPAIGALFQSDSK